jgi:multiple sugar transport system permease protein
MAESAEKQPRVRDWRGRRFLSSPYLLLVPAAIALAGVSVYPLFYGVRASFTHYLYGRDFGFNGLTNYRNVWNDTFFRQAMLTTAKYVVICVIIETLLGLALALLVSREIRFGGPIRVGLILPMTIAPVVVGVMWRLLYDSGVGVTDPLFQLFGLSPPDVLAHDQSAFYSVVLVDVWEWTPLIFLILLAGLQSLPQEPLEAARGACGSSSTTRCPCCARCSWSRSSCARSTPSAPSTRSTCSRRAGPARPRA